MGPLVIDRRSFLLLTGAAGAGATLLACADHREPSGAGAAPRLPDYTSTLTEKIPALMAENGIPGAIVLIRSPEKGDWKATFGVRKIGEDSPPDIEDHVRIASITKTMTATVVLQLQQEGALSIDEPVSRYVTGVPNGDAITLAHLAEMRSGLYSYADDPEFAATLQSHPDTVWTPRQLLTVAFAHPPNFEPGSRYEYNNTNYVLLGLVIEKVTGMTAADALRTRIFDPLDLQATTLPAAVDSTLPDPHPRGYMWGPNEAYEGPLPQTQLDAALAGDLTPSDHTDDNPSWAWTAGGVISRAEDVAVFVEAMVAGSLLDVETRQWRLASMRPTDPSDPGGLSELGFGTYGFGLEGAGPMYGHPGNIVGFAGLAAHDPEAGNTVVILTTVYLTPQGGPPQNVLFAPILAELYPDVAARLTAASAPDTPVPTSSTGPGR